MVPNLHAKNGIYKVCCVRLWLLGAVGGCAVVRGGNRRTKPKFTRKRCVAVEVAKNQIYARAENANLHAKNAQNLPPKSPTNAYIIHLSTFPMIFMLVSSPASMR
ncbi:MAG: hypothetical protein IKR42_05645 [Campylobacter sp.]|nr:hypothetical protein [Campylobacter sp.]